VDEPPPTVSRKRSFNNKKGEEIVSGEVRSSGIVGCNERSSMNVFEEKHEIRKMPSYELLFEMTHKHPEAPSTKEDKVKAPLLVTEKSIDEKKGFVPPLMPSRSVKQLTVPIEFNFAITKKATKLEPQALPKKLPSAITVPKSPKLMTKMRSQRDRSSLSEPKSSPKKVTVPRITVPVEPKLSTALRSKRIEHVDPKVEPIKALPVPKSQYDVPKRKEPKITLPQTPKFAKPFYRPLRRPGHEDEEVENILPSKQSSRQGPFVLPGEAISAKKRQRFQEAIDQENQRLNEARLFHAHPIPDYDSLVKVLIQVSNLILDSPMLTKTIDHG